MRSLVLSSFGLVLIRAVGVLAQAAIILYLARRISIGDVGRYATIYGVLGLVRYLGPVGMDHLAIRLMAASADRSAESLVATAVVRFSSVMAAAIAVVSALVLIFVPHLTVWSKSALVVGVFSFSLAGAFVGVLRGGGNNWAAQVPEAVGLPVSMLIGAAALAAVGALTLETAVISLGLCSLLVLAMYLFLADKQGLVRICSIYRGSVQIRTSLKPDLKLFRTLVYTGLSVRAPLFLAGAIGGAPAAAIMDIAQRFGSVASLTTGSVAASFSPKFAELWARRQASELMTSFATACSVSAIPAVSWLVMVVLAGPMLIGNLLPAAYANALPTMCLIAVAYAVNAAFGLSTNLLMMLDRSNVTEHLSLLQLSLLTIAGFALFQAHGPVGLGSAIAIGTVVRDGGALIYSVQFLRR